MKKLKRLLKWFDSLFEVPLEQKPFDYEGLMKDHARCGGYVKMSQKQTGIGDRVAMQEPKLTPFTCIRGHPGYPVRSNVIEVNGRFRRIKKWIGGRPGLLDRLNDGQPTAVMWLD